MIKIFVFLDLQKHLISSWTLNREEKMNIEEIKSIIMYELPNIVRTDKEVRWLILDLGREQFLNHSEANRRFDRILDELAEHCKEYHSKLETWEKRWEEY